MNSKFPALLLVQVLLILAVCAVVVPPACAAPEPGPVRTAVRTFLQGLIARDAGLVQASAHLPALLVYGSPSSDRGRVLTLKPQGLSRQLAALPAVPGGQALPNAVSPALAVTFLGNHVAVGILHPRPRPGAGTAGGCAALLGRPPRQDWKVVCLIVGPANAPLSPQVPAIKQALGTFWQALFNNDMELMQQAAHLPYADVENEKGGADIQIITARLLMQLQAAASRLNETGGGQEPLDANLLVNNLQVRFFGRGAAVALYSSALDEFSNKPQECAIVARNDQGKWQVVAVGSD